MMTNDPTTIADRRLAECFHVGEFIADEMAARGWTSRDVAARMGGEDDALDELALDLLIACPEVLLGDDMPPKLARAFGVPAELFVNLDRAYRDWKMKP